MATAAIKTSSAPTITLIWSRKSCLVWFFKKLVHLESKALIPTEAVVHHSVDGLPGRRWSRSWSRWWTATSTRMMRSWPLTWPRPRGTPPAPTSSGAGPAYSRAGPVWWWNGGRGFLNVCFLNDGGGEIGDDDGGVGDGGDLTDQKNLSFVLLVLDAL